MFIYSCQSNITHRHTTIRENSSIADTAVVAVELGDVGCPAVGRVLVEVEPVGRVLVEVELVVAGEVPVVGSVGFERNERKSQL